jgi:hypothetical protein
LTRTVQAEFSAKKGSTPGIVFDDPDRAFSDPSLLATYRELALAMQNGEAIPVQPWMGVDGNSLIVPLRDGLKTPTEVAADFMNVYPGPYGRASSACPHGPGGFDCPEMCAADSSRRCRLLPFTAVRRDWVRSRARQATGQKLIHLCACRPIIPQDIDVRSRNFNLIAFGFQQLKNADAHRIELELRFVHDPLAQRQQNILEVRGTFRRCVEPRGGSTSSRADADRRVRVAALLLPHLGQSDPGLALALIEERHLQRNGGTHRPVPARTQLALGRNSHTQLRYPASRALQVGALGGGGEA